MKIERAWDRNADFQAKSYIQASYTIQFRPIKYTKALKEKKVHLMKTECWGIFNTAVK